jgi:hypothetical protein
MKPDAVGRTLLYAKDDATRPNISGVSMVPLSIVTRMKLLEVLNHVPLDRAALDSGARLMIATSSVDLDLWRDDEKV